MKKTVCVLLSLAMVFASMGSAIAADADCNVCKDNVVPGIQCPIDQGDAFCPFDYDRTNNNGLCDPSGKIIFDICSCPTACRIEVGNVLGVKIDILTAGVYFALDNEVTFAGDGSTPANNRLQFSLFPKTKVQDACEANDHTPGNNWDSDDDPGRFFTQVAYYKEDNLKTPIAPVPNACIDKDNKVDNANKAKVMMVLKRGGYIINNEDAASKLCQMWINVPRMIVNPAEYKDSMAGQEIKIRVSAFTELQNEDKDASGDVLTLNPLNYDKAWNSATGNMVDVVDQNAAGQMLLDADHDGVADAGNVVIWDPAFAGNARIQNVNKIANIGNALPVKVDAEWISFAKFLCPDCYAPCGCDFAVAKFCCDATNYGMLYPYFAPDNDESVFWNGIAISNLSLKEGTANITIYEMDGDIGKASVVIPAKGIYNSLLRNIQGLTVTTKGTGDTAGTLGNSKAYIWVCSNFIPDGFAMISDNSGMGESMGYIPRSWWRDPSSDTTIINCD